MKDKIKQSLLSAGLPSVPEDSGAALADYGFDSLMIVLFILDLQRQVGVQIPAHEVTNENMQSLDSIDQLLKRLGAA